MSKNKYAKSSPKPVPPNPKLESKAISSNPPIDRSPVPTSSERQPTGVRPEHISLLAYKHIQQYIKSQGKQSLSQEDLNAVLRLSQHLRVFGLLSAIGYVNQSNAQEGKVRQRTVPVWTSLLGQLVNENNSLDSRELMQRIQTLASDQPGDLQNLLSERLQQTQPLVNLLVVDLEPVDIPLCQSLRRRYPHLPILALGPPVSRDQLLQFQQLGLAAYVERYTPAATLWQWMQAILGGYSPK